MTTENNDENNSSSDDRDYLNPNAFRRAQEQRVSFVDYNEIKQVLRTYTSGDCLLAALNMKPYGDSDMPPNTDYAIVTFHAMQVGVLYHPEDRKFELRLEDKDGNPRKDAEGQNIVIMANPNQLSYQLGEISRYIENTPNRDPGRGR